MPCREATASVIGAFLGNDKHHLLIVLSRQVGLARQGFSRYLITTKRQQKTTKDNRAKQQRQQRTEALSLPCLPLMTLLLKNIAKTGYILKNEIIGSMALNVSFNFSISDKAKSRCCIRQNHFLLLIASQFLFFSSFSPLKI